MRILRITPHLFREGVWPVDYDPFGGLQTQVWRLTRELDKGGVAQKVLTSTIPGFPRHSKISSSSSVDCLGVALPKFAAARFLGVTWFIAVARYLFQHRSTHDLVHIHYNHWVWCRILTVIARRLDYAVVVSLSTELWVSSKWRWLLAAETFSLARRIEAWAIRSSNSVIMLTQIDATRWRKHLNLQPERVFVIPDAIDTDNFRLPRDERGLCRFRRHFRIPSDKQIVAFIGRIRSEKGWQDLPKVTTELHHNGAFMLVCGDGPDRQKLERALCEIDCQESWTITGFLEPSDITKALEIADVLVLPSRREAFGSVLLESMASGVPAVAYAVGGIVEVAGTPHAIRLVPPNDCVKLTRAILELLTDQGQRSELVSRGSRRVNDFSLQQMAQAAVQCYEASCREPSHLCAAKELSPQLVSGER